MSTGMRSKKWMQKASEGMKKKGTVGAFTKQAHSAGYDSPSEYATHVIAAPEGEFSGTTRKRANFAKNANR